MSGVVRRGSAEWHTVQFYESDASLVETVCGRITSSLENGRRVIVVATSSRRSDLEKSLAARGIDIPAARARNQYADLDAAEALSRILVNARPDATRFARVCDGLVAGTRPEHRGIWIFGEMVALLWAQRMHAAALRLEALWNGHWNDFSLKYPLALHCGYPLAGRFPYADELRTRRICAGYPQFASLPGLEPPGSMHHLRAIERLREQTVLRRELESARRRRTFDDRIDDE